MRLPAMPDTPGIPYASRHLQSAIALLQRPTPTDRIVQPDMCVMRMRDAGKIAHAARRISGMGAHVRSFTSRRA
jgi:hypothetical protein